MKIIAVVGKVDSRVLVYPLARALGLQGLTAVIADDGAYRRLYFGDELQGNVSGVDISVGLKSDKSLSESLNNSGVPYDYMIVVSSGYVPDGVHGVVICKGVDKSMQSDVIKEDENGDTEVKEVTNDNINIPHGVATSTVYISYETPPKDGAFTISLRDTAIRYIYSCEERKELQILDDKSLNKNIAAIVSELVRIDKSDLLKLLLKSEYLKSK